MSSGGGSSGSQQPTQQTVTQSNIPEWARPYAERLLGQAEALTDINQNPYQSYGGQRIAELNSLQKQAYGNLADMGIASQLGKATDFATIAGNTASQSVYNPATAQNYYNPLDTSFQTTTAPQLQQYQMAPAQQVMAPGAYSPDQIQAERVASTYDYDPERVREQRLKEYRMGPAALVSSEQFGPGSAAQYMSPFMQDVVERQKREAIQDYARQIPGMQAAGIRSGARGGTREALVQAEAQRNLANQLGGIQATGLQSAYQQAMQQYNVDQAQRMQAQLANQAAIQDVARQNLQAAMGIQSLGAGQNLQAQLANQGAFQRSAEFGAGQNMQAALANQQAALQAAQLNQAAKQRASEFGAGQGMQAALANQQAGLTTGQQNLAAALQTQGLGANLGMQSQQLNQAAQLQAQQQALAQQQAAAQYGLAGANLAEQSRQFGANYGIQNIQQQLAAAGMLGNLGQQQYQQGLGINQAQLAGGSQLQALKQAQLDTAYQDFLNQQKYPYQQLGFMSDILRGVPATAASQSIYQAPPSLAGQIAGAGLGLAGLYRAATG
jgi:hypothetical protein